MWISCLREKTIENPILRSSFHFALLVSSEFLVQNNPFYASEWFSFHLPLRNVHLHGDWLLVMWSIWIILCNCANFYFDATFLRHFLGIVTKHAVNLFFQSYFFSQANYLNKTHLIFVPSLHSSTFSQKYFRKFSFVGDKDRFTSSIIACDEVCH